MKSLGLIQKAIYFEDWVFEDATTGSMIFIYEKGNTTKNLTEEYLFDKNRAISLIETKANSILDKYESLTCPNLASFAIVFKGMAVKDRASVLSNEKGENPNVFLLGNCIARYVFKDRLYTDYGKLNIVGGTKDYNKHSVSPRILIRRTGDFLCCVLLTESALTESTLYSCYITDSYKKNINLKFLISVLNSTLLTYIVRQKMITNEQAFPQILMADIQSLKIKICSLSKQQPFIEQADIMLQLNEELQNIRQRFTRRLTGNIEDIKMTRAIDNFDELDFKQLLAELKKQKITLSLIEQDEWDEYFHNIKSKCNDLSKQIEATDKQIDEMVYKLYELTDEEIEIVENS